MNSLTFVERKGIGHPDTVADLISEEMMSRYRVYVFQETGLQANGWFDKVVVSGGESIIDFGSAEIVKKPKVILYGKAMKINGSIDYITILFSSAVEYVLDTIFGSGTYNQVETEVAVNSGMGAEHAKDFYDIDTRIKRSKYFDTDIIKANDTVITSGWWPMNEAEKSVITIENYINSRKFKEVFPQTGYDVKVVVKNINARYDYTICIPFIAVKTESKAYYEVTKQKLSKALHHFICTDLSIKDFTVSLNTKDNEHSSYITVFGSAFDKGDVGITGRGNRYPGIISVLRSSGVEAFAGKNPFNHTGKLYTILATDLARRISAVTEKNTNVILSSDNGDDIYSPKGIFIQIDGDFTESSVFATEVKAAKDALRKYYSSNDHEDVINNYRNCYGLL